MSVFHISALEQILTLKLPELNKMVTPTFLILEVTRMDLKPKTSQPEEEC